MFQTITIEQCTVCVWVCVKQLLRVASSHIIFLLSHKPGLDLGHAKGSPNLTFEMTERLLWPLYYFMGAWMHTKLTCRLLSIVSLEDMGLETREENFGLCMGLDAVTILGVLIHMAVCARRKKARLGFWDCYCNNFGEFTISFVINRVL